VDAYDDGAYGDSPYTGSYTVNSDGTFTGSFAGSYSVFTMTGVLENGTAEMEFTYDESGVGGVVACIGESTYGPVGTNPVAATPTFSPAPGAFTSAEPVTLADTTRVQPFITHQRSHADGEFHEVQHADRGEREHDDPGNRGSQQLQQQRHCGRYVLLRIFWNTDGGDTDLQPGTGKL